MFSKVAILATVSLALSAAAAPRGGDEYTCNTGSVQCCNQTFDSATTQYAALASIVGVAVQGVNLIAGANCSPATVIGVGSGASCTAQPVCCEDNHINGAIVAGCSPVNVGL